jgi:hypothetical protein
MNKPTDSAKASYSIDLLGCQRIIITYLIWNDAPLQFLDKEMFKQTYFRAIFIALKRLHSEKEQSTILYLQYKIPLYVRDYYESINKRYSAEEKNIVHRTVFAIANTTFETPSPPLFDEFCEALSAIPYHIQAWNMNTILLKMDSTNYMQPFDLIKDSIDQFNRMTTGVEATIYKMQKHHKENRNKSDYKAKWKEFKEYSRLKRLEEIDKLKRTLDEKELNAFERWKDENNL